MNFAEVCDNHADWGRAFRASFGSRGRLALVRPILPGYHLRPPSSPIMLAFEHAQGPGKRRVRKGPEFNGHTTFETMRPAMQSHSGADISTQACTSTITLLALLTLIQLTHPPVFSPTPNLTCLALITVVVHKIERVHNFR